MSVVQNKSVNYTKILLAIIGLTLVFRWVLMAGLPLGLHGDEAQYWSWSRDLDWGYYSKPPLIAWIIAGFTSVLGHAEWAIRLPSALFHSLTAWFIFLTAKQAFDIRIGFWTACTYLFMPAVWLSSTLISTDVPLLLCWVLALNAWVALRENASWFRAAQLGFAIGFGLLAKYAMLFFLPVIGLAVMFDKQTRQSLLGVKGLFVIVLIIALFAPNILWNLNHDFATLSHTADNANLSGPLFNISELLTFWGDQFGVFGLISLPLFCLALLKIKTLPKFSFWLALLATLPLFVISFQAFVSRANANWAVTAYIAAPILVAIYAVTRPKALAVLKYGLIGQSVIMIAAALILLSPALTQKTGLDRSVKRMQAWPETVEAVEALYKAGHNGQDYEAVATDNRLVYYDLQYYGLAELAPLYVWSPNIVPNNHAEMTAPLPKSDGPILLLNYYNNYESYFEESFDRLLPQPPLEIDLGGGRKRVLKVWVGYNHIPAKDS
ncbi:dolichyl-phosphate-mannose-protein mannosyltransferase [Litorimonas taeanensis]|uniref:Dolichyl-phosphate-mannose-protein mannosyltransferase n=1 Tax=Litorimonas taeanensis TaxID=568099 RepID=A0A420WE97_9PROT|nr:glycosyltransferase family 39 protein [Litorimonas taeanensis]RKQ69308.1 dolichyl-phosphate-mannose-protein mannosyltransferase [Litorimonas taeanensis]